MEKTTPMKYLIPILFLLSCSQSQTAQQSPQIKTSLPSCEWCGTNEAPENITWETTIAPANEPGERMTISGTVYNAETQSPAEGIIIYIYHTNAKGIYQKRGDETGNGQRHGYLRSWVKTNAKGDYRFHSIKPASYPNSSDPAHIHMTNQRA